MPRAGCHWEAPKGALVEKVGAVHVGSRAGWAKGWAWEESIRRESCLVVGNLRLDCWRSPLIFLELEAGGALKTGKPFSVAATLHNHYFPFWLVRMFS